ncbi:hypothetical protein JCM11641_000639 [Rhodosporidiobolus odoratus]
MEGTFAAFPAVVQSLNSALTTLPSTLTTANLSLLASLLSTLSSDLTPALPSLASLQLETILTNTTYLAQNLGQLSAVTSQIPKSDVSDAPSPADLIAVIEIGVTKYDILTVWAPEVWAVVGMFAISAGLKIAMELLVKRSSVRRTQEALMRKSSGAVDRDRAREVVRKPAKAALGHSLNCITSTFALVLQCMAWRLFVLPGTPLRMNDIRLLSSAMKILLVGYGADLLFGDLRPEIFLHHFFTFALLLLGQLAAFETKSPKFFRMAQYLILQATTEQTTYLSMVFYHFYTYLRVQDHRPKVQRSLLRAAQILLNFTRWITFPQKMAPAAFAVYWLVRMWGEVDDVAWGKAWIICCTIILSLLMILQIRFCDDIFPLAAYIGYKLHGGSLPPKRGPVMRVLLHPFTRRRSTQRRGESTLEFGEVASPVASAAMSFEKAEELKEERKSFSEAAREDDVRRDLDQIHVLERNPRGTDSGVTTVRHSFETAPPEFSSPVTLFEAENLASTLSSDGSSQRSFPESEQEREKKPRPLSAPAPPVGFN